MIVSSPFQLVTTCLEQLEIGFLGKEKVGVHVIAEFVTIITIPFTVNIYTLSVQLPSVFLSHSKCIFCLNSFTFSSVII